MNEQKFIEEMAKFIIKMGSIAFVIASIWIITIAYIATKDFQEKNDKTVWITIVIFLGPLGCILFWLMGRKHILKNMQYTKQKENRYKEFVKEEKETVLIILILIMIVTPAVLKFNAIDVVFGKGFLERLKEREKPKRYIAEEREGNEENKYREKEYTIPEIRKEQPVEIRQPNTTGRMSNKIQKSEEVYYYIDKNGISSFTDNHLSIPSDAREVEDRSDKHKRKGEVTKIAIENDHVYVPVKIRNKNNDYYIWMVVDTGATGVTIHHDIARKMNIQSTGESYSIVADGRKVPNLKGRIDKISVGPAEMENFEVSIMYNVSPQKYGGLLGMKFLKNFNYTIDLRRQEIQWN